MKILLLIFLLGILALVSIGMLRRGRRHRRRDAEAPSGRARQGLARRTAEGTEACRAARVGESLRDQRAGTALTDATTSAEPRRLTAHGASGGRRSIRAKARAAHPPTPPSSGHRRARCPVARSWPGRGNARGR